MKSPALAFAFPTVARCETCFERPGFPEAMPGKVPPMYECAVCRTLRVQCNEAQEQLSEAVAPIVGVWAAQWTRAGVPLGELLGVLEQLTGEWMAHDLAADYRSRAVRALAARYRHAGQGEEAPPARVQVTLSDLRTVARMAADPDAPPALQHRRYFFDEQGKQVMVWAGGDAVVMTLPDGARVVTYPDTPTESFLCPARLWPDVAATLGHLDTPEAVA